jgi:hypothetical protein
LFQRKGGVVSRDEKTVPYIEAVHIEDGGGEGRTALIPGLSGMDPSSVKAEGRDTRGVREG